MSEPLRKEAKEFRQTSRTGWILTMTAGELTRLMPVKEVQLRLDLSLPTETNRPISPNLYPVSTPSRAHSTTTLSPPSTTCASGLHRSPDREYRDAKPSFAPLANPLAFIRIKDSPPT